MFQLFSALALTFALSFGSVAAKKSKTARAPGGTTSSAIDPPVGGGGENPAIDPPVGGGGENPAIDPPVGGGGGD